MLSRFSKEGNWWKSEMGSQCSWHQSLCEFKNRLLNRWLWVLHRGSAGLTRNTWCQTKLIAVWLDWEISKGRRAVISTRHKIIFPDICQTLALSLWVESGQGETSADTPSRMEEALRKLNMWLRCKERKRQIIVQLPLCEYLLRSSLPECHLEVKVPLATLWALTVTLSDCFPPPCSSLSESTLLMY